MYKVAQTGMRLIAKTQTQTMGMFQNGPLRAPSGPQTNFASEQIIDMLAEAAGMDPWKFRIQNIRTDGAAGPSGEWPRYAGVLNAAVEAAKAAGYVPHVPASNLAVRQRRHAAGAWASGRTTTRMPRRSPTSRSTRRPARSPSCT